MGRRPRSHQSSGYGLTTILVAGLAFVDSFNLVVRNPQHSRLQSGNPRPCPSRQQRHVRTTPIRSTCSATPRGSLPDGSPSPRRSSERKAGTSQQPTRTPVVTTRTRASASKSVVTRLSEAATTTAAAPGNGKDSRGNGGRGKSEEASSEGSYRAAERRSKALQQKQRLQRSMGGLEERAVSRGQLLSSLALVGAATAILGGSGVASASTGVRFTKWGGKKLDENT